MFGQRQLLRLFYCTAPVRNSSTKSQLAKLRKKTGYGFSNCKKALELNGNDVEKAEKWLHDQAQALGWSKATSLGGRKAKEGLVSIMIHNKHATMVELNCETDFVSRNKYFQSLAETVAKSCLNSVSELCVREGPLSKALFSREQLASLPGPDGKTLADHVAVTIGIVGENMVLRRAVLFNAAENIHLAGYSHPSTSRDHLLFGKYGAIVALREKNNQPLDNKKQELSRQLCQHVVGMNPNRIGDPDIDKPCENSDDETVMIHQEFLLDPSQTVQEVFRDAELEILDYARFECGEEDTACSQDESAAVSAAA